MKKCIIICAALLCVQLALHAQVGTDYGKKKDVHIDKLTKDVTNAVNDLSEEQLKKIVDINSRFIDDAASIKRGSADKATQEKLIEAMNQDRLAEMKKVLNEKQWEAFEKHNEKNHKNSTKKNKHKPD